MGWFRLYHEARSDAKLLCLTDAQHRTWFNLLCLASEQPDRGTIAKLDERLLAVQVAAGDREALSETLSVLESFGCIAWAWEVNPNGFREHTIRFTNFRKRQELDEVRDPGGEER